MSAEPVAPQLASPCVGTCRLDPATGWCIGCGRDAGELLRWRDLAAAQRAEVWAELPGRLRQLGQDCRLLPWLPEDALAGIAMLAKAPGAVLVMGVEGAVGEFTATAGGNVLTRQFGDVLELHTAGGRARLVAHPGLRVFAGPGRTALTLHRSRLLPMPSLITELGADRDAMREGDRALPLVDLGLGRPGFRFTVRLSDPALLDLARRHCGRSLFDEAGELIDALIAAAPTRVLITPLGRVEVDGPIDRIDRVGPATHLLPEQRSSDRPLRSGPALPEAYAPLALVLVPEAARLPQGDRVAVF